MRAMEPVAPASSQRVRELAIGVGSAAGILALVVAPWWVLDIGLLVLGALALWWARSVPLERVMSPKARLRLFPLVTLVLAGLVAYSAYEFVARISLLFMAALLAGAAVILVTRWLGFVRDRT